MIAKECKHTLPDGFGSGTVVMSAPSYSCVFCEIERLRAENEKLRRERDSYANSDFERQLDDARVRIARVEEWTHEHGAALCPRGADTYGEGMRDAKQQVARILSVGGTIQEREQRRAATQRCRGNVHIFLGMQRDCECRRTTERR